MRFLSQVRWNLATIGAFITILRLGFSPLVQQTIQLESRNIDLPDEYATLGHTYQYMRVFSGIYTDNMSPCKYILQFHHAFGTHHTSPSDSRVRVQM